jgi:hypothetical protein
MVASLNGIIFDQIYGDNSGGAEFDTDGDGTTTQEDEFVSFTNTTGAPIDVSGWEIWSDMAGSGAPDSPQDGLFHVFPPGTIIAPGETLYVINEITGSTPYWAQEASEGGVESGAGGANTNFLTEGDVNPESIALVDPSTGDFLVFNMDNNPSAFSEFDGGGTSSNSALSGFPGDNMVAEIDGHSAQSDQNAGSSYQYNSGSDSYTYSSVFVSCLAEGTWIDTPSGAKRVERLKQGDAVRTQSGMIKSIRLVMSKTLTFKSAANECHRPITFAPGSLGAKIPTEPLSLSPQHRVLVTLPCGTEALCPAKGLLHFSGVRRRHGMKKVTYFHIVLDDHDILLANGAPVESFFAGPYSAKHLPIGTRLALNKLGLSDSLSHPVKPLIGVKAYQRQMAQRSWSAL